MHFWLDGLAISMSPYAAKIATMIRLFLIFLSRPQNRCMKLRALLDHDGTLL